MLARFGCFCCSESEGERDRLRFESASGMGQFSLLSFSDTDWVQGLGGRGGLGTDYGLTER